MKMNWRLEKSDSSDIAFVESCLISGAITESELTEWIYHVIEHCDQPPTYLFDILDEPNKKSIFKGRNGPIGFYPSSDLTQVESDALTGLGHVRGILGDESEYDPYITKSEALTALKNCPHIVERFRLFFPFIALDYSPPSTA